MIKQFSGGIFSGFTSNLRTMKKMMLSDFVSYQKAGQYMGNLPDTKYPPNKKQYLCGGTFTISNFWYWANLPGFSGLMFWYGLDPNQPDGQCFVGVEPKFNFLYDENSVSTYKPSADIFVCPGLEFNFSLPIRRDFERFLRNDKRPVPILDRIISKSNMQGYNANFLQNSFYKENHKYGMAYFSDFIEDQPQVKSFLKYFVTQGEVAFLRYYLGFEETSKGKFLRLILVPVDEKGKNTEVVTVSNRFFNDVQLLQKSWPPPPNS
ncbi:hypothetical protein [Algoriphagus mannitolivorans]|uniref:hypothetical protein n=1 Tax=Algoriphagus mannitolivorans TaxID=226504 RepID=UPI00047BD7CC|nr:hypothetical protein [Algoriphagus mannitolivorans]